MFKRRYLPPRVGERVVYIYVSVLAEAYGLNNQPERSVYLAPPIMPITRKLPSLYDF